MMQNYALLVGINRYEKPGNDLAGCLNDIIEARKYLLSRGWERDNILMLQDAEATRTRMVMALTWLMKVGGRELLFWYSGHGSQVPSMDPEERDHKNEIICPYDFHRYWHQPLGDDALKEIFRAKPSGSFLTVVLDSCHSQGGTRSSVSQAKEWSRKIRYQSSPLKDPVREKNSRLNRFGVKQLGPFGSTAENMNHVLLSACMSYQTAADAEFAGQPHGAWSWALLKSLQEASGSISNHDLHRHAALLVKAEGFSQKPCIEGRKSLCDRLFPGGQ